MQEISVDVNKVEKTLLFFKLNLPDKGWLQLYVDSGFEAVIIPRGGDAKLYGNGRKETFLRKKLEAIYFIQKQITEPLGWGVEDIPTSAPIEASGTSEARGHLYISVQHSRKLVEKVREMETADARSVVKSFIGESIAFAVKGVLNHSVPGTYDMGEIEKQVSDILYEKFDAYGLCLDCFRITAHKQIEMR